MTIRTALACLVAVSLPTAASASVLFEETFETYSDGDLIAQSDWTEAATDKSRTVQSSTFSYGTQSFGSKSLRVTETNTSDKQMAITFTTSPVSGQDVYVAYYGYGPEFDVNPNFYSNLGDGSNTRAGLIGTDPDVTARLTGGTAASAETDVVDGDTFVVLARYNWDAGNSAYTSVDVWVERDGTLPDSSGLADVSGTNLSGPASIDSIGFSIRGSSWNDPDNQFFDLDNVRVGTTAEAALTGIPEPASLVLVGLGSLLVVTGRRRARV